MKSALLAILHQEVWAAGVTYYRSRTARIEESKSSGGADFRDNTFPEGCFLLTGTGVVPPDDFTLRFETSNGCDHPRKSFQSLSRRLQGRG
jgi:hypothetical protein